MVGFIIYGQFLYRTKAFGGHKFSIDSDRRRNDNVKIDHDNQRSVSVMPIGLWQESKKNYHKKLKIETTDLILSK